MDRNAVVIVLLFFFGMGVVAQDAQWRGPSRDGIFPEQNLLKEWPEEGPELLMTVEGLGKTNSSVVVTPFGIYATGLIDSLDVVTCMDHSGKKIWQKPFGKAWDQSFPETRSTPLIEDDRLYVLSGKDNLVCFNAESGEVIWEVDLHEKYKSVWDMFGVSESVLLVDDKVIVTPCGDVTTVLALDKMTGEEVWKSKPLGVERSNGSAVLFTNDTLGIEQIIAMNRTHVMGVDPDDGEIYWTYEYNKLSPKGENTTILANSPVFFRDDIYITDGWDTPSVMLEISADGKSVKEKYVDHTLDNQNHGVVRIGEFVYGSNFLTRSFGKWVCMRWETGEVMWVEEWEGKGPIIAADGLFYLLDERRGNMALVNADENDFEVLSTFKVEGGRGPFWARPSIYGGKLYVRHGDVMLIYDVEE